MDRRAVRRRAARIRALRRRSAKVAPRSPLDAPSRLARRTAVATWRAKRTVQAHQRMLREEIANSLTHGLGLVLAFIFVPVLIVLGVVRGDLIHVTSFSVYGGALIAVYTTSTLYHAFFDKPWKDTFHVLDHMAIYLLIAGTYTPIVLLSVPGPIGWTLLTLVWTLTVFGMVYKLFYTGRFERFSLVLYLLMGWSAVLIVKPLMAAMPAVALTWIVAGGVFYTAGTIFFVWRKLPYSHAIWHLFVLAGSACHYYVILGYVLRGGW
ncbi:MAG: hemolysin III family protein [Bacteroidota bacterium]